MTAELRDLIRGRAQLRDLIGVDGSIHGVCIDTTKQGVFLHSPQSGAGTLYYANANLALTKSVITGNVGILVGSMNGGPNGSLVVQNGALPNALQPPAGLSFDDIALSPDGNTMLVGASDSSHRNIYMTTYTPITTTNNAGEPVF